MNLTCFLAFFFYSQQKYDWFKNTGMLICSEVFSEGGHNTECEGVVVRASKYFTVASSVLYWFAFWGLANTQRKCRRTLRWGLPNCGSQGASDSPGFSSLGYYLAKETRKRKRGSRGRRTLFCSLCRSCSVRVPVTQTLNFSSSYLHVLLLRKKPAWSCC